MKQVTVYDDAGTSPVPVEVWSLIDAGDPSTPRAYRLRNTGTQTLESPVLSIVADGTSDADEMARIGIDPTGVAAVGSVALGTSPIALGTMAPTAERRIVVNWIVPESAPASAGLRRFRLRVRET